MSTTVHRPGRRGRRTQRRPSAGAAVLHAPAVRWMGSSRRGPARQSGVERAPAAARTDAPARKVLVVDDDAALRTLYRFNLEASGASVVEAPDGEAALALLEEGELPDVVLLDVMMPGMDGWTVAERLAADERTAELPVVFITARAEDEARARGRALGAAGYLTKPFNPVALADEIEAILGAAEEAERQE